MKLSRFVRNERGAALVEMALVLPIVILLFLGIIDFGRALFLYNNLTNAAREGARFGAASFPPVVADITTRVESRITDFSGVAVTTGKVQVTVPASGCTGDCKVTVKIVNYPFTPITPLPQVSGMTLSVGATFRWEGTPSSAP